MKRFMNGLRQAAGSFTSSATDPREVWAEPGEKEIEGLRKLQSARAAVSAEIERLSAIAGAVRSDLDLLRQQDGDDANGDDYKRILRQRTEADVDALDDQLEKLRVQLKAMDDARDRLKSRVALLLATQRPAETNARQQPGVSSLPVDAAEETLAALNKAVEGARNSAARLQDKTADVFKRLTERGDSEQSEDARRLEEATRLATRFTRQVQWTSDPGALVAIDRGAKLSRRISNEYRLLHSVTTGRSAEVGHRSGYVVGLAAQTHDLGLRSLWLALESLEEMTVTGSGSEEGQPGNRDKTPVYMPDALDGHIRQALACADAIAEARDQVSMLVAGENEVDVKSATVSLRRAVEHASEVQRQMNVSNDTES